MMPATKQTPVKTSSIRMVHCLVGEQEYCFEMSSVSAITRAHNIVPNEESNSPVGWLNAKHMQMPIYDFGHQLGTKPLTEKSNAQEGFVLILKAIQPFALKVDRVLESLEVKLENILPLPAIADPQQEQFFKGIIKNGEQWALYADPVKFHPDILQTREPESSSSSQPYQFNPFVPAPPASPRQTVKPQILLFSAAAMPQEKNAPPPIVFGLSLTQVQQILDVGKVVPIPCAPSYVLGVMNWRNIPLPIIDLHARLGITNQNPATISSLPKSRLLIARTPANAELIGFVIAPQVKAFPLPLPYQSNTHAFSVDQELVFGVFDLEGMPLVIPNLDGVLTHHFVPQPMTMGIASATQ